MFLHMYVVDAYDMHTVVCVGICKGDMWCICMCVVCEWVLRSREARVLSGCSEPFGQQMTKDT